MLCGEPNFWANPFLSSWTDLFLKLKTYVELHFYISAKKITIWAHAHVCPLFFPSAESLTLATERLVLLATCYM